MTSYYAVQMQQRASCYIVSDRFVEVQMGLAVVILRNSPTYTSARVCPKRFNFACMIEYDLYCHIQRYAEYMFNAYDTDGDGEIDFVEYIRTMSVTERGSIVEQLKWTFSVYDINGDGQVSLKEATEILTVS